MIPTNRCRADGWLTLPDEALRIASSLSSPAYLLDRLARWDYEGDRERGEEILLGVAENLSTPPRALAYLIEEALPPVSDGIREAAIRNPNCSPGILTRLSYCQGDYEEEKSKEKILMEIALHKSAPWEAIQRLCFAPFPAIRSLARNHPVADQAWLKTVVGIPDSFVRKMFGLGEW